MRLLDVVVEDRLLDVAAEERLVGVVVEERLLDVVVEERVVGSAVKSLLLGIGVEARLIGVGVGRPTRARVNGLVPYFGVGVGVGAANADVAINNETMRKLKFKNRARILIVFRYFFRPIGKLRHVAVHRRGCRLVEHAAAHCHCSIASMDEPWSRFRFHKRGMSK